MQETRVITLDWYGLLTTLAFADRVKMGELTLAPLEKLRGDTVYLEGLLRALLQGPNYSLARQKALCLVGDMLYLWVQRWHWGDKDSPIDVFVTRLASWGFTLDEVVRAALVRYAYKLTAPSYRDEQCIALIEAAEQDSEDGFRDRILALLLGGQP